MLLIATNGYGEYLQGAWFHHRWSDKQLLFRITTKEIYPITAAIILCGETMS